MKVYNVEREDFEEILAAAASVLLIEDSSRSRELFIIVTGLLMETPEKARITLTITEIPTIAAP